MTQDDLKHHSRSNARCLGNSGKMSSLSNAGNVMGPPMVK